MIDYNDTNLMRELKREYDETLKRGYLKLGSGFYEDDFPYSDKYPLYLKKKILTNIIRRMPEDVYQSYKDGSGHELSEGPNGQPPKFLSIGSSSAFCFNSLYIDEITNQNEAADYFSHDDDHITEVTFEKKLSILGVGSIPAHMDAYAQTDKREYFFECKCHEMFDPHPIELSKKYFTSEKHLFVQDIPPKNLIVRGNIVEIRPQVFGVKHPLFDIKQFLTHLMAIGANKTSSECDFIYFYSLPTDEDIVNAKIKKIVRKTLKDAKKVFRSKIIKGYCRHHHINLRMYSSHCYGIYPANRNNIKKIY